MASGIMDRARKTPLRARAMRPDFVGPALGNRRRIMTTDEECSEDAERWKCHRRSQDCRRRER